MKLLYLILALALHAPATLSAVREGTQVQLSPSEVADLKQWVENAKQELTLLQDDTLRGTLEQRRKMIIQEFEAIVNRSSKKENELLTRYTLNRALEIDELVGESPAPSELQSLVSFLDSTIVLAKSFYTDDQKYLEAIGRREKPELQLPMAVFAHQYAENLLEFSRTFVRPSLEYQITYKALGWLANDLNSERNLLRIQFAESITRIARLQGRYPETAKDEDAELLQSIRKLKWEYRERVLHHVLEVNKEITDAIKRAEAKRREDERLARLTAEERRREEEAIKLTEQLRIEREAAEKRKLELIARLKESPWEVSESPIELDSKVWARWSDHAGIAKVIDRRGDSHLIRFDTESSPREGWSRASLAVREGCALPIGSRHPICVGDKIFAKWSNHAGPAAVVGIAGDRSFLIQFDSESLPRWGWSAASFALNVSGACIEQFCVGQRVTARWGTNWAGATLVGVSSDHSSFVVRFDNNSTIYWGWTPESLRRAE